MNLTELMIGDWYYWEAEGKKYPLQVTKETFTLADEDIANFQPIPLTGEILEKNGFELDKELTEEDENKWYKHYFKDPLPNVDGVVTLYISFDEEDQNPELSYIDLVNSLPFKYVHQLQHILKDIQIEKILKV